MEYSVKKLNEVLQNNEFSLKKKFGQNFIIDENIIDSIINKAEIDKNTVVIEIGPGAGSLTYKLCLNSKHVICYEIDTTLKPILEYNLKGLSNVDVYFEDFLKADIFYNLQGLEYQKLYVVANLPYYITTPIIEKIIEDGIDVDKMVVMVQKEVGARFKATPGNKEYGSLSVYINYYFHTRKLMDISRNIFIPRPNVDSMVVEFSKKDLLPLRNRKMFFKLVRDSFRQKRKTLRNNLQGYDLVKVEEILKKYDYDLSVRAEQLSVETFVEIANNL